MTTIVNTPPSPGASADEMGVGLIIGLLVAVLAIVLFFIYGWPALRQNNAPAKPAAPSETNITITTPSTPNTSVTQP